MQLPRCRKTCIPSHKPAKLPVQAKLPDIRWAKVEDNRRAEPIQKAQTWNSQLMRKLAPIICSAILAVDGRSPWSLAPSARIPPKDGILLLHPLELGPSFEPRWQDHRPSIGKTFSQRRVAVAASSPTVAACKGDLTSHK